MADDKSPTLQQLEQLRDRIEVQMHLASMDAREQWANLEKRYEQVKGDLERRGAAATRTVGETADRVGEELREGYEKLANILGA